MHKKHLFYVYFSLLPFLVLVPAWAAPPQKVVSLGGSVTEIIYALNLEDRLIGTDLSSVYPKDATQLPSIGYYRNVPIEGVIALAPDTVLASEQAGPEHVLERLPSLGIRLELIDDKPTLESLNKRIEQIAKLFNVPERGKKLLAQIQEQMPSTPSSSQPVKALVLMMHSNHTQAAGKHTAPALLLQLAGMHNVLDQQNGYRSLSSEAIAALAPDVIILTGSAAPKDNTTGANQNTKNPTKPAGLQLTPAAKHGNIATIDPLLMLSIGPRIGQSLDELTELRQQASNTPSHNSRTLCMLHTNCAILP